MSVAQGRKHRREFQMPWASSSPPLFRIQSFILHPWDSHLQHFRWITPLSLSSASTLTDTPMGYFHLLGNSESSQVKEEEEKPPQKALGLVYIPFLCPFSPLNKISSFTTRPSTVHEANVIERRGAFK